MAGPFDGAGFRGCTSLAGDTLRLWIGGDVDLGIVPRLAAMFVPVRLPEVRRLEVDLAEVMFFSCAGLRALVDPLDHGVEVVLVAMSAPAARFFAVLARCEQQRGIGSAAARLAYRDDASA